MDLVLPLAGLFLVGVVPAIGLGGVAAFLVFLLLRDRMRLVDSLEQRLTGLGFEEEQPLSWVRGGIRVSERAMGHRGPQRIVLTVGVPTGSLVLSPVEVELPGEPLTGRTCGDRTFDRRYRSWGQPQDTAVLDEEVRELLMSVPDGWHVTIDGGVLGLSIASDHHSIRYLEGALELVGRHVASLQNELGPWERLEALVLTDPAPGVRARAIRVLEQDPVRASRVAPRCLHDVAPEVRLVAARVMGHTTTLQALALDEALGTSVRAGALRGLAADSSVEVRVGVARTVLDQPQVDLRRLGAVLLDVDDPTAVPVLLRAIRDGDSGVRSVAVRLLGAHGTAAEVPQLAEMVDELGSWSLVGRDVRRAHALVRTRARGRIGGGLSVAAVPEGGALSVPAGAGGGLAVAGEG